MSAYIRNGERVLRGEGHNQCVRSDIPSQKEYWRGGYRVTPNPENVKIEKVNIRVNGLQEQNTKSNQMNDWYESQLDSIAQINRGNETLSSNQKKIMKDNIRKQQINKPQGFQMNEAGLYQAGHRRFKYMKNDGKKNEKYISKRDLVHFDNKDYI